MIGHPSLGYRHSEHAQVIFHSRSVALTIQNAEPLKDLVKLAASTICLAIPKSASLTRPLVSTNKLAPFTSAGVEVQEEPIA